MVNAFNRFAAIILIHCLSANACFSSGLSHSTFNVQALPKTCPNAAVFQSQAITARLDAGFQTLPVTPAIYKQIPTAPKPQRALRRSALYKSIEAITPDILTTFGLLAAGADPSKGMTVKALNNFHARLGEAEFKRLVMKLVDARLAEIQRFAGRDHLTLTKRGLELQKELGYGPLSVPLYQRLEAIRKKSRLDPAVFVSACVEVANLSKHFGPVITGYLKQSFNVSADTQELLRKLLEIPDLVERLRAAAHQKMESPRPLPPGPKAKWALPEASPLGLAADAWWGKLFIILMKAPEYLADRPWNPELLHYYCTCLRTSSQELRKAGILKQTISIRRFQKLLTTGTARPAAEWLAYHVAPWEETKQLIQFILVKIRNQKPDLSRGKEYVREVVRLIILQAIQDYLKVTHEWVFLKEDPITHSKLVEASPKYTEQLTAVLASGTNLLANFLVNHIYHLPPESRLVTIPPLAISKAFYAIHARYNEFLTINKPLLVQPSSQALPEGGKRRTNPDPTGEYGHPGRALNFETIWQDFERLPIQMVLDAVLPPYSSLRQELNSAVTFDATDLVGPTLAQLSEMSDLAELAHTLTQVLVSHLLGNLVALVRTGRLLTHLSKPTLQLFNKQWEENRAMLKIQTFPTDTLFSVRAVPDLDGRPLLGWAPNAKTLENYEYVPGHGVQVASHEKPRADALENRRRELDSAFALAQRIHQETESRGARSLDIALRDGIDFEVRRTGHDYIEIDMKPGLTPATLIPLNRIPRKMPTAIRPGKLAQISDSSAYFMAQRRLAAALVSEIEHVRRPDAGDPEVEPAAFLRLVEFYGLREVLKIYPNAPREQSEFRWRIHYYMGSLEANHPAIIRQTKKEQADFLRQGAGRTYLGQIFSKDFWTLLPDHELPIIELDGAARKRLTNPMRRLGIRPDHWATFLIHRLEALRSANQISPQQRQAA